MKTHLKTFINSDYYHDLTSKLGINYALVVLAYGVITFTANFTWQI